MLHAPKRLIRTPLVFPSMQCLHSHEIGHTTGMHRLYPIVDHPTSGIREITVSKSDCSTRLERALATGSTNKLKEVIAALQSSSFTRLIHP